jgi:hypothetical protein
MMVDADAMVRLRLSMDAAGIRKHHVSASPANTRI